MHHNEPLYAGSGGSEGELGTDMPDGGEDSEGGGLFSSIWDMVNDGE